jgi:citrate lyase beta subunit
MTMSSNTRQEQLLLGASMYVPLTQPVEAIIAIANSEKFPNLRSVIFDTEDSVRDDQVNLALRNLREALPHFRANPNLKRFVRVRTQHILGNITAMDGVVSLNGFVLPKITASNIQMYLSNIGQRDPFMLMPTLETQETFDKDEMIALRNLLLDDHRSLDRIICLRIGGNDLLNCLRIRRNPRTTIYDTAIGNVIAMLSGVFIPHGIGLSAPVCEVMNRPDVLQLELQKDLDHGLFGKTAIHPDQIPLIEAAFAVYEYDYTEALQILDENAPAVFRATSSSGKGQRMCEPTTHRQWAQDILARAKVYGVRQEQSLEDEESFAQTNLSNLIQLPTAAHQRALRQA